MESYTNLERLEYALLIYRVSFWFIIPRFWNNVEFGFCNFFNEEFASGIPKALYQVKPKVNYNLTGYWYKPGRLSTRIELLKKAIRIEEYSTSL